MKAEKIQAVAEMYRHMFEEKNIPKKRMDQDKTLGQATSEERLAHAHYLLDGVVEYSKILGKEGKTGRHLASIQMILSFENWFTIQELRNHNRSDEC